MLPRLRRADGGDFWIAATIQSCRDLFLLFFVVGAVHFILVLLEPRRSGVVDSALTVHGLDPLLRTCRAAAAHGKTYQRLRNISPIRACRWANKGTIDVLTWDLPSCARRPEAQRALPASADGSESRRG